MGKVEKNRNFARKENSLISEYGKCVKYLCFVEMQMKPSEKYYWPDWQKTQKR